MFPVFNALCMLLVIIIELTPVILDAVVSMNNSQPRQTKINFELFIDQEQYFYIYLIYEIIAILIGLLTITGTGTLSLAFFRHCCATFKIARYLLILRKKSILNFLLCTN